MANLNQEFLSFYDNLQITRTRKEGLMTSRDNLRAAIKRYFWDKYPELNTPCFWIQGSYKMGTAIRTENDECDLDDGVYFIPDPHLAASTLKARVYEAVEGITNEKPINKNKCIRVNYAAGYHIDLPVYVKDTWDKTECPKLAVRDSGFVKSDPRQIVNWFEDRKANNAQLVRIVSYLKAWADHVSHKMPPGLVWTTLASDCQHKMEQRDDIALVRTIEKIYERLKKDFKCNVHGVPYDDLLGDYDAPAKVRLLEDLKRLKEQGNFAIEEKNKKKASLIWIKLMGERYPEAEDVNEEGLLLSELRTMSKSVLAGKASIDKSGNIGDIGVATKPHKFYGE